MKRTIFFTAMLALVLAFGLAAVSCDTDSDTKDPPKIPTAYTGDWNAAAGFPCFVINSDGSGSVFMGGAFVSCTWAHSTVSGVEKLKMITSAGECSYDSSVSNGILTLANPAPDAAGATANLGIYASLGPYTKYVIPEPPEEGTPITGINDIVGSWKATNTSFVGEVVFVINADGTGQTMLSGTGALDACTWAVTGDKVTLNWEGYGMVLECTFDGSLSEDGQLILANPNPSDSILAPYYTWGPFDKE